MPKVAIKSFKDVLEYLRSISTSESDKGTRFELLMKKYFETDPIYADMFETVWTWNEFPLNGGKHDTGIDLVAKERISGNYCAIQCKFYDENYSIQKKDIDSFFTESGKKIYENRIIVSSTDKWSNNAELSLENQSKPVARIRLHDLDKSAIDWSTFMIDKIDSMGLKKRHTLLPHQQEAHDHVLEGLANADRGKLIMACGTGKTFTSLKIAESVVTHKQGNSIILYLVPSISLLSQTLREWNNQTTTPFHSFAVCSDRKVSRTSEDITAIDLGFPATTDSEKIVENFKSLSNTSKMTVVFSTYQSIEVLHEAQQKGFPEFDLIISDEAHRTTGVTLSEGQESHFVRVHDNEYIKANKRLYQTATPKVFGEKTKNKADEKEALLSSMDDVSLFGEEFHNLGFGEAVERGLLTDYKVMVLVTDQNYVDIALANEIKSESNTLNSKDFARIVGTWNGLSKRKSHSDEVVGKPMKRAVAFTSTIETSKQITQNFQDVVDTYAYNSDISTGAKVEIQHVDGTMNTLERNRKLDWLKEETDDDNVCRILSNARCLTEGVDVPDLDSVIFFNPRNSVIDVIQAVGRVMRKADEKEYGYIILPITINKSDDIETELNNNKEYKVVWQVLQALRSHDERFNAMINQMELNMNKPANVEIIGHTGEKNDTDGNENDSVNTTKSGEITKKSEQIFMTFPDLEELQDAIYGQIVDKVGDKRYWENWSNDVAEIARRHFDRIKLMLRDKKSEPYQAFQQFLSDLRNNLNNSIEADEAIEMLSQHLITKPVFKALFEEYSFVKYNPVSQAMEKMLSLLEEENLEKETRSLDKFYESVKTRASKIDNLAGKQKVIIELYDKFFGTAFKKTTERLGIVYTPVEVVDFIINSVNEALKKEFGTSLSDKNVHILDPFTGTGTFIVRLIQSGSIRPEDLLRKYTQELHANEIVLLAYYIATINIEEAFHDITNGDYVPFEGIVLTDTFQMTEGTKSFESMMFPENNSRVVKQNNTGIQVIIGNPPYSVGQKSENDANQNVKYLELDRSIKESYVKYSTSQNKNSLYDAYIRAIRWSTNRIKDKGIVCFVTNGAFIDNNSMDGFRKCILDEYTSVYCFNLRGNQRTSGETSRKEGGKIFGSGSRAGISITMLIKNPDRKNENKIHYYDIGDYLSREDKLHIISEKRSYSNIDWEIITPDEHNDWINQRDTNFDTFMPIGEKTKKGINSVFVNYSSGVQTSRDAWAHNYSFEKLEENMKTMIDNYNNQVELISRTGADNVLDIVDNDPTKISWSSSLRNYLSRGMEFEFDQNFIVESMYRPFSKQWLYFDKYLNHRTSQIPKIFPIGEKTNNLAIYITGASSSKDFSALILDCIPSYDLIEKGQCFPLYTLEKVDNTNTLFEIDEKQTKFVQKDNISNLTLNQFKEKYGEDVEKEDIFYYVYGILYSEEYKSKYQANLKKELPRIPFVKDFWAFSNAGRSLAELHLNYESVEPYPLNETITGQNDLKVTKMRFGKTNKVTDKSIVIYNNGVALSGIPLDAYNYVVNGKSAIEWLFDQYQIKTDTASQIKKNPNDWSDNQRYILDLLKRVVAVSMETNKIVNILPDLEIIE
ncbi:type ISP restriction/modification enzyme [Bacillus sp. OK048]|uniref:DEAD/DEAH box helicase n=1 Tax=Bacillus sp. OK048 TaxID=1882761 RepID=UPI0008882C3E|nr:type ISP restriction/modification enzyme [Bacillus sp. OK048]SDN62718.1 Predicted helicase [Bacillus sp. OK048]